jgi:hypothetical protein
MKVINVKKNVIIALTVLVTLGLNACSLIHDSKRTILLIPEVQENGSFVFRDSGSGNILKFETCVENSKNKYSQNHRNDCPTPSPERRLVGIDTLQFTIEEHEGPHGSVECCFKMSTNIPGVPPYKACFIDPNRNHCIVGKQQ